MKDDRAIEDKRSADERSDRPGTSKRTATFVIVLTLERSDVETESEWLWRVRSVETNSKGHFHRLDDLLAFISAMSGSSGPH